MKKLFTTICTGAFLLGSSMAVQAQQNPGLPVVDHDGHTCYFYTIKGNESVYGILSRFGWEEEVFMTWNPKAATLKKGDLVYYPVEPNKADDTSADVPLPVANQESEAVQPVVTEVQPVVEVMSVPGSAEEMEYTVKTGDGLYALAREYQTTVAQILSLNPGLVEENMRAGDKIRITPYWPKAKTETVTVTEKKVVGSRTYKVNSEDTWQSIAAEARVPLEILLSVNDSQELLRKGRKIKIPLLADTLVTRSREAIDPREETPEGRLMIYNETHGLPMGLPLDVTVLTGSSAESHKRDLEFVRGFLLGLKEQHKPGQPVSLHVRQFDPAQMSEESLAADSTLSASRMILATFDKDFPFSLSAFGDASGKTIVNVFDAKSENYLQSPSTVQVLPPSWDFYDDCASYLLGAKGDSKFIFVAEDESDGECISLLLLERLIRDDKNYETIPSYADLATYPFDERGSYVIVSDLNKRADISKLATDLEAVIDRIPTVQLSVVGRPTWVVYADPLKEKLQKIDTYIPSRFYLNPDDAAVKAFEKEYMEAYGAAPLKSFPGYAAMGYDMARYFLTSMIENGGDLNMAGTANDALQLDMSIERPELWSGFLNGSVYLIHFTPYNTIDKIRL